MNEMQVLHEKNLIFWIFYDLKKVYGEKRKQKQLHIWLQTQIKQSFHVLCYLQEKKKKLGSGLQKKNTRWELLFLYNYK